MVETNLGDLSPFPLRFIGARVFRQRLPGIRVTCAQEFGVATELFRQPLPWLFSQNAIQSSFEVRPTVQLQEIRTERGGEYSRAKSSAHLKCEGSDRRICLHLAVPLLKRIDSVAQFLIVGGG